VIATTIFLFGGIGLQSRECGSRELRYRNFQDNSGEQT